MQLPLTRCGLGAALALIAHAAFAQVTLTVQGEEVPEKKPWTAPAQIAFKWVEGKKDHWDVAIAPTVDVALTEELGYFVNAAVLRRTNPDKEQEYYALKTGLKYHLVVPSADGYPYFTLRVAPNVSWNRLTYFKDPKTDCSVLPLPVACLKQHEESLRGEVKVQPYWAWMNSDPYREGDEWKSKYPFLWSVGLVTTPYLDRVVDAKRDATGLAQKGSAYGIHSLASIAVTPRFGDYRFVIRSSVKHMVAADRTRARAAAFPANSILYTGSVTYEFGNRSFEYKKGWAPSFGVTYMDGDDPLTGRVKSKDATIAFKVSYTQ